MLVNSNRLPHLIEKGSPRSGILRGCDWSEYLAIQTTCPYLWVRCPRIATRVQTSRFQSPVPKVSIVRVGDENAWRGGRPNCVHSRIQQYRQRKPSRCSNICRKYSPPVLFVLHAVRFSFTSYCTKHPHTDCFCRQYRQQYTVVCIDCKGTSTAVHEFHHLHEVDR